MSVLLGNKTTQRRQQLRGVRRAAAAVTQNYRIGERYYTVKELAEQFKLTPDTMYRRIRRVLARGQALTLDALAAAGGPA